jgi:hypothetical protein
MSRDPGSEVEYSLLIHSIGKNNPDSRGGKIDNAFWWWWGRDGALRTPFGYKRKRIGPFLYPTVRKLK